MHQNHSANHETTFCGAINDWTSSKSQQHLIKMQLPRCPFIPTFNAITSSQKLQWMVQPAVLASMPGYCLCYHPYKPLVISNSRGPGSHTRLEVVRTVDNTHGRSRWSYKLNQAEGERTRLRRERNKLAAVKCLNSRRKLTDQEQGEIELEREQANLQTQVERLQKEIEKLVSHTPVCLLGCDGQSQAQPLPPFALTIHPMDTSTVAHPLGPPPTVKQEPQEEMLFSLHHH